MSSFGYERLIEDFDGRLFRKGASKNFKNNPAFYLAIKRMKSLLLQKVIKDLSKINTAESDSEIVILYGSSDEKQYMFLIKCLSEQKLLCIVSDEKIPKIIERGRELEEKKISEISIELLDDNSLVFSVVDTTLNNYLCQKDSWNIYRKYEEIMYDIYGRIQDEKYSNYEMQENIPFNEIESVIPDINMIYESIKSSPKKRVK